MGNLMRAEDIKFRREKEEWYTFPLTFWDIVDELDWVHNSHKPSDELRSQFRELCYNNDYVIEYFRNMRRDFVDVLENVLYEDELETDGSRATINASDDTLNDILNHIVGCGKDVYFDVLLHPEKVYDYMSVAVESFAYVMR